MGFSYEEHVGALDYDFTSCPRNDDPSQMCTAKGRVPEPCSDALQLFEEESRQLAEEFAAAAEKAGSDGLTAEFQEGLRARAVKIVADVCDGSPSLEELTQLPPRVFGAFAAWLRREIANPKG